MREEAIRFLPAQDALATLRQQTNPVTATMLDPWYNRGVGGVIADSEYDEWLTLVLTEAGRISDHVFFMGLSRDRLSNAAASAEGTEIRGVADMVLQELPLGD